MNIVSSQSFNSLFQTFIPLYTNQNMPKRAFSQVYIVQLYVFESHLSNIVIQDPMLHHLIYKDTTQVLPVFWFNGVMFL